MPIHRPTHSAPRDVYLHLLATLTLFISVISLLTLLFQYINLLYPDPLGFYRDVVLATVRGASSSLVVAFPLFVWVSSILYRDVRKDPARHELVVRKWLTYFTLLVAAVSMIVYLIMIVNGLYGGELTVSFGLKALSVLVVAGAVFGYYLWDVRMVGTLGDRPRQAAVGSSAAVLVVLAAGLVLVGSPTQQRNVRFDGQRVSDLQSIQAQLVSYYTAKSALPDSTDALVDSISGYLVPTDPETGVAYGYELTSATSFKLCATFATTDSSTGLYTSYGVPTKPVSADPYLIEGGWAHVSGPVCFSRTIDPDRILGRPAAQTD